MKLSDNTKRYLYSTLVTFLTGFLTVLSLNIDKITVENMQNGLIVGIILSAARAGVKAIFEYFIQNVKPQ